MTIKGLVSIVIPSRNERFLSKTILDLLEKAKGDIEIIVNLDGYFPTEIAKGVERDLEDPRKIIENGKIYWEAPAIINDPRVTYIHQGEAKGMRSGINAGVAIAKGEYILKCDAHTMWGEGFDEWLKSNMQDDWVVIPRRKRLDAERWAEQQTGKPDVDYEYLSFPDNPSDFGGAGLNGRIWTERILERKDNDKYLIDDNMSFQGSAWFMKKEYFEFLELMDAENYSEFWNEAQEIGFKCWLSGGKVVTNKKTWYAHLHKGKTYGRGYHLNEKWVKQGATYTLKWLTEDKVWHKQTMHLKTLIEHFMPVPGWPEDRSLWFPQNLK